MVELPLVPGLSDLTTKLFNLPNNHRRLAREKMWIFTAAALPGWLQVGVRRDTDTVGEFPKQLN